MKYVSTRGSEKNAGLFEVLLNGLAPDGGLYLPTKYPRLSQAEIKNLAFKPYIDVAKIVLAPYIKNETKGQFENIIQKAYKDSFSHPAVTPMKQIEHNQFVLELFYGPTMSFKDVAMQFLAPMMEHALKQKNKNITIVGATSGDTGSAAIHAFANNKNADIFILFPHNKISDVQKWQMTGVNKKNVHAIALNGNFDDCQNIVKQMLANKKWRESLNLTPVNSINWGRIIAQTVYYFVAAANLNAEKINFVVPTGNFGDIFAGYVAKKMGLNINKLIIATNQNDILARTLKTGRYEIQKVKPTSSPSMDIQVSSNFERLLFEASNQDADYVKRSMDSLKQNGAFGLTKKIREKILAEFNAESANQNQTKKQIKKLWENQNYLVDPHTAVGIHVAQSFESNYPTVILSTASPHKFPKAIKEATGVNLPKQKKPKNEKVVRLNNNVEDVLRYVTKHSRAGK